jgi:hypothetical protein
MPGTRSHRSTGRLVGSTTALRWTRALDEAALWQDQEAARYGGPSDEVRESGSRSE